MADLTAPADATDIGLMDTALSRYAAKVAEEQRAVDGASGFWGMVSGITSSQDASASALHSDQSLYAAMQGKRNRISQSGSKSDVRVFLNEISNYVSGTDDLISSAKANTFTSTVKTVASETADEVEADAKILGGTLGTILLVVGVAAAALAVIYRKELVRLGRLAILGPAAGGL